MIDQATGVPVILISRSAYSERQKCPRAFAYRYLWKGGGFQERRTPIHLAFGIALHKGVETLHLALVGRGDEDEAVQLDAVIAALEPAILAAKTSWTEERPSGSFPPFEPPQDEITALLEALLFGWVRVEAARFISEYKVLSVEKEGIPQPLSPSAALQFRADAVLRSRYTGGQRVWNTKTTSSWQDWTDLWTTEIQASSEAWAVQQESGEAVEGTVMAGFYKGALRQTGGEAHFGSPLLWGYKRQQGGRTVYWSETKAPPKDEKWEKFATWKEVYVILDEDGAETAVSGVRAWVSFMPMHGVAAQFSQSEVLPINEKAVKAFIAAAGQEAMNDHHILSDAPPEDIALHFSPKFGRWSCGTKAKPACPFFSVCWGDDEIEDLVEAGVLVPRKDHHATT